MSIITDRASYETGDLVLAFTTHTELLLIDGFGGNLDGKHIFGISWSHPGLTNAGGTLPLFLPGDRFTGNFEGTCTSADCFDVDLSVAWDIVSGSVTTVPEPASLTLLGLGLTAITAARGWRSRALRRCYRSVPAASSLRKLASSPTRCRTGQLYREGASSTPRFRGSDCRARHLLR